MRFRYLITSEMRASLDKENFGEEVKRKLKDFEQCETEVKTSSLLSDLFLFKQVGSAGYRYVWIKYSREDVSIFVLRKVYRHDVYEKELTDATKKYWRRKHELSDAEMAEVEDLFSSLLKKEEKSPLPEEYRKYEEKRAFDKDKDVIIYEMPLWHDGIRRIEKDKWEIIRRALAEDLLDNYEQYDVFLYHRVNNYTITYRRGNRVLVQKGRNGKEDKYETDIFLLQIVEGNEPDFEELVNRQYDNPDVKYLTSFSSKCYPDYYTYDYDTWKEVEEDNIANLALSEEEVRVLQDVEFPFFVSGLAGSGKSTILYYLYANIYKYMAKEHPEQKLLFLSYNDALVENAKRSVRSILKYHKSNQNFDAHYFENPENQLHFNETFVPFRGFLKYTFLDDNSISLFKNENHISYEKFRELYKSYPGKKVLSPAILWSVIRTFIKGRSLDFFTPEDYSSDSIVKSDRTVDNDVYKEAYKLWDNWYRHFHEDKGMWDDLDLVRYCLTHGDPGKVFHTYSILFCDEAQDFTKLEIDLILRLSVYSKYDLSTHPNDKRIPIAFAGDPNQTINPTGFRWAGTKAIFNKSFEDSVENYPELDDQELSKNYRSQLGIVKFANTVQTLRYKYFDNTSKDRKLQSVREDLKDEGKDALEYVGFYSYDKYKDVILQHLGSANIITSGEGEDGDRSMFPDIKDENVKLSTAMGTKGLEYNAVMLLNFCNDPSYKLFQNVLEDKPFASDSERFEAAHFFTKLYIAISRARSQLFIVDTDESYEKFWKYFTEHDLWKSIIEKYISDPEKRCLVGHVTLGDIQQLPKRLSDTYDPEENAYQAFEKAKSERSAALMSKAQGYFMEAGLRALADECDAYISLFNGKYETAGDLFLSISKADRTSEASDAYWKGNCWTKLLSLISSRTGKRKFDSIRLIVSSFMTGQTVCTDFLQDLVDDYDSFHEAVVSQLEDQDIWKKVFDKLRDELTAIDDVVNHQSISTNLDRVARLVKWYDNGFSELRASLYFRRAEFFNEGVGRDSDGFRPEGYVKAAEIWKQGSNTIGNTRYFKCMKLTCGNVSEEIGWMDKLGEYDEILRRFGDATFAQNLSEDAQNKVFTILLAKDMDSALSYPYPRDTESKWNRVYFSNRGLFLDRIVLDKFSYDKFVFLQTKVVTDDNNVFTDKLSQEEYLKIFNLKAKDAEGKPYWAYFLTQMKGIDGYPYLKNDVHHDAILDAMATRLNSKDGFDHDIASAFLEILFGRYYNYGSVKKHCATLISVFSGDKFLRDDFRMASRRNPYFTLYGDLDNERMDQVKGNIVKFVRNYMDGISKKLKGREMRDKMMPLCLILETCVPYTTYNPDDVAPVYYPDHAYAVNFYNNYRKSAVFELAADWMNRRRIFNELELEYYTGVSTFAQIADAFKEKDYDLEEFVRGLGKDDAMSYVTATNVNDGGEYSFQKTFMTARAIYDTHIRKEDFRFANVASKLRDILSDPIDKAIDELLANKSHVNEYQIKILAYVWEALGEHPYAAKRYESLAGRERLERVSSLKEYFYKRALLHYSYARGQVFEQKVKEFGISMDRSYLPKSYPAIIEKEEKQDATVKLPKSSTPAVNPAAKPVVKNEKTATTNPPAKKDSNKKTKVDPQMATRLEIARNLKALGTMTTEMIMQATGLSEKDVKNA